MRPTRSQRRSDQRPRLGPATPGTRGAARGAASGDASGASVAAAADSGTAVPTVVGAYLREIGRTPLLHPEEEVALAQRVARGETEAAHALAQANLRLVVTIASHYRHCGLPLEDLIAEGNIGLLHAVQKYEWQRGCRFSTYAVWWIRQAITRAIGNHGHLIRVPVHLAEALARHTKAVDQLANALGWRPSATISPPSR